MCFKVKDLLVLTKNHRMTNNNEDSVIHIISRWILENYIYLKYLLCNEQKINLRLNACICKTLKEYKKIFNCLIALNKKGKYLYHPDENHLLSEKQMILKVSEWDTELSDRLSQKNLPTIEKEVEIMMVKK